VFVSFLYAWIAADIAKRFSDLSSHWSEYTKCKPRGSLAPVVSHLFLAAFVVATSWLGWTLAFVHGDVTAVDIKNLGGVIAPSSLLLIVDFWILGTYFAFVRVVHRARRSGKYEGAWSSSSGHAAYWVVFIQLAYLLWDFFVYFLIPYWTHQATSFWHKS
jgi:hypothetical protein